jgi:NitT/TauT family transport system substrate-binding protein
MNSRQLNRRTFASATASMLATLTTAPLWAQARLEKTRISIAVDAKTSFYNLPLTIAEQLGYFQAEGLEVRILDLDDRPHALQAALSGGAEVVSGAYEDTLQQQIKGQRFQAFVLQGRAPAVAFGISLKAMPNYKAVVDLKGRRIGISGLGSSSHRVVLLILSRAGLKADDVSLIAVGSLADALAAFRSGQIDALCNVDPVLTMLEQKGEIRIIADTRTLKGTVSVFGGAMPAACLYAPINFVQKNPNTMQALTHAMVHSLKWLQTAGPRDIIKTVPEAYLLGDRALYLAAFNKIRETIATDGLIPEDGARTAVRVLANFDPAIKIDKIELAKTYTNEFARKAKERFKV